MFLTYIALAHKATKKSSTYGVIFPDFPGLVSAGDSLDKAMGNAREGLIFHMEGLLNCGEIFPKPTSIDEIMRDTENKKAIPCLIHVIPPKGELKRINISIDAGLLAEIDHTAILLGQNRSEFLSHALREALS